MKYRIAISAFAGFLVAAFWALYFFPTAPTPITSIEPMWTLARFTCPIAFASFYFHFSLSVYWSLLVNSATYALIAMAMETLRRQPSRAR